MKRSRLLFVTFPIFISLLLLACQSPSTSGAAQIENSATEKVMASPAAATTFENIDVNSFKKKMTEENTVVLDVRTPAETQMGIVKGAIIMDISQPGFKDKIDQLDKSKTYLVYCKVGGRSTKACSMMAEAGFDSLFNLEGGYNAWLKQE